MNFVAPRLALLAGLVLPFGLATASLAQDAPPSKPAADAPGMRHHWGDRHAVDPAARRAHMAAHLSTVLQLQPGQQAALAAYLDAMKPPADMADRTDHARPEAEHATTPERLDKILAHFEARRAHMVAHVQATKLFYAQLSPSQQKAFDELAPMMMRRRFGGDHHGMMGHRHDGEGPGHEMGPGGQPTG